MGHILFPSSPSDAYFVDAKDWLKEISRLEETIKILEDTVNQKDVVIRKLEATVKEQELDVSSEEQRVNKLESTIDSCDRRYDRVKG